MKGMNMFKTGDLVKLKSGGPIMTVRITDREGLAVRCDWFGNTDDYKTAWFESESLELMNGTV